MQLKGTVWNALGSTMWGAQSFIMLTLVSRVASVEQVGWYGIAFTTAQILYIIGQFGVTHYQMTDYAEKYTFRTYFRSRFLSASLMAIGCAGVIFFMHFTGEKALYTIALAAMILCHVFAELHQNLFFQKNRLDLSGSSQFVRTLVSLSAFCVVLLWTKNVLYAILAQTLVCAAVAFFYAKVVAKPFLAERLPESRDDVRGLVAECFPLFLSVLFMNVMINASKYGVEWFMDDAAHGYFNLVFMPAQVINLCSQFIFKPYLRQYAASLEDENGSGEFIRLLRRQLLFVAGLTAAACAGAYLLGAPILGFIYDKDISAYALTMTWVVLGGGLLAVCQLFYYILVLCRRQKIIMILYAAGMAAAALLSVLLVRRFGLSGAAWTFALSHALLLIGYVFFVYKNAVRRKGSDADA